MNLCEIIFDMNRIISLLTTYLFIGLFIGLFGQEIKIDTTIKNRSLTGTKAVKKEVIENRNQLVLHGYISSYFAYYNVSISSSSFQQLPTVAPTTERFSLNLIQLGGVYESERLRGVFTLHWRDRWRGNKSYPKLLHSTGRTNFTHATP